MLKPLFVILACCLIHATLYGGQSLEIPNIEAAQRALQERYMRFYEIADGLGYDLGDAPPHLTFPSRAFDGRAPGLFPEDCFYEQDIFDEETGRADTEVIYNLIGDLINQPLPDWDYWVHPSWHGAIEGRDAANGRMGVLGPIPYPGNVMTPENYLQFFYLFTLRLNEMSVLQFQVRTTDLSGDPDGAPMTRNVGIGTGSSCPMAKLEALDDFSSNASFPLEQPGTIFNLERTQGTHFRYVELVGGIEERHTAYIHGTEGRFVVDHSKFPGTAVVYGRLYDAALINLGFPSSVDLAAGNAPHGEYNRWFRLDTFSGIEPGPYLSAPFAEHAEEVFLVPCPTDETAANGEYFGWGIAARLVVTSDFEHLPSDALVACGDVCFGCSSVGGLCSEINFGSLDFRMGLGKSSDGDAGFLQVYNETIDPLSASPFGLRLHLTGDGTQILRDGDFDNVLRQGVSEQVLIDIEVVDPYRKYVVRHYHRGDGGTKTNGFYQPDPEDAFKEVTIENPQPPQYRAVASTDLSTSAFFFFARDHGIPAGTLFQAFVDGTAGALPEFWVNGPLKRNEFYVLYAFDEHHLTVMWWDSANGWWDFDAMVEADASQTLNVQSPQPFGTLTITETRGGRERIMEYSSSTASPATDGMFTMSDLMENKQRHHTRTRVFDSEGATFIDTVVKKDGEGNPIEEVERHYRVFPWNHLSLAARRDRAELVKEVRDPQGNPRVKRYAYYDDPVADGHNYGRLKSEEHPDGSWAAYEYDAEGRTRKVYRPFLDSELSLSPAGNRVEEVVRQPVEDLEGTGIDGMLITRIESVDGEEVSRRYRLVWSEPVDGLFRSAMIDALSEGADWHAAQNMRTDRWSFAEGAFKGKTAKVKHSEGTMSFYSYATDPATGEKTTTVRRGVPNGNEDDVIDGTETVTVTNPKGGRVSRVVSDIQTGIVLESAITMPEDFDELGRPLVILFHDGTFETREYEDCCGTVTVTDRSGLTRVERMEMDGTLTAVESNGITFRYEEGYQSNEVTGFTRATIREGRGSAGALTTRIEIFDPAGRLLASIDPRDGVERLTRFDESLNDYGQHVIRTILPDGAETADIVHRDGFPRLHRMNGLETVRYEYGFENATHEIFDGNDFVSHSFTATTVKEIRVGMDGEESEWEKHYLDMLGRVYKVETPDAEGNSVGNFFRTFYDTRGFPRKTVDPDGVTTLFGYNERGDLELTALDIDGQGEFDPSGTQRITRIAREVVDDPDRGEIVRRTVSVWETDHADHETVVASAESSTDGLHVWESLYDQPPTHIEIIYEGDGRIVRRITGPDGSLGTLAEVNGFLESETVTHPGEGTLLSLTHSPDGFDRRATTTDHLLGTTTTFEYYDNDLLRRVIMPESEPGAGDDQNTEFVYDVMGRLLTTKLPNEASTERRYHEDGALKIEFGHGRNPVEYAYDRQGRLRSMTTWREFDFVAAAGVPGEGATTAWTYNSQGNLESKADPAGEKVRYTYTAAGRIRTRDWARLGVDGMNPVRTVYGYGPGGVEDESVFDGNLRGVFYENDPAGTPPVRYTYHRSGRVATIEDGSGLREFGYKAGLLSREDYIAGEVNVLAGISIGREFDLRRLQGIEVEAPAGTLYRADYSYGNAPYLKSAGFRGHQVSYGNNPGATERQVLTYDNGDSNLLSVVRHFDNLNRLTKQESAIAGGTVHSYRYRYTDLNQRDRMIGEDGSFWAYGYDELGQVTSGVRKRLNENPLPGYVYGYTFDHIGNRIETTVNERSASYTTNLLNQYKNREVPRAIDVLGLAHPEATITVGGESAVRDGDLFHHALDLSALPEAGSPQQFEFTVTGTLAGGGHNDTDRVSEKTGSAYLPANPEIFYHDADGNLLGDGRWSYVWDAENRLIRMESAPEAVAAGVRHLRLAFVYDSQHRRIRKTVEEFDGGWAVADDSLFVYDGWNLLAELDAASWNVERSYLWGLDLSDTLQGAGGVGGLLMIAIADEVHYPVYDGNGNIMRLLNAADGTANAQYEYGPFGELLRATGPAAQANPFRFSTKYTDIETNLVYYGFRYLNPDTGRWLSRDPIEEFGGLNLYAFVYNDPLHWFDDGGLRPRQRLSDRIGEPRQLSEPPQFVQAIMSPAVNAVANTGRGLRDTGSSLLNLRPDLAVGHAAGTISGILSLDSFQDLSQGFNFEEATGCVFLITATGVGTDLDGNERFQDDVSRLRLFSSVPDSNIGFAFNPTSSPVLGINAAFDIITQSLPQRTLGAITPAARQMANTVEMLRERAMEDGCRPECIEIHIIAHSQGTGVAKHGLRTLSPEIRSSVHFIGIGGETRIREGFVGSARNIADPRDPVAWQAILVPRGQAAEWVRGDAGFLGAHGILNYLEFIE